MLPIDWNTWRTFNRRDRHGDMVIIQWVRVLKR
jgi:hypothetical protein